MTLPVRPPRAPRRRPAPRLDASVVNPLRTASRDPTRFSPALDCPAFRQAPLISPPLGNPLFRNCA